MTNDDLKRLREELTEAMKTLTSKGFTCYLLKENKDGYLYGYIVTPNRNVIYIQQDDYRMGWMFSLQYVPSRSTGGGCGCLDNPVWDITEEIILKAEREGLAFARKLKATLYASPEKWLADYWHPEDLEQIT